jgi:hypothetical protein
MCNICYAKQNEINFISANPSTLCQTHHREWADEKNLGENY